MTKTFKHNFIFLRASLGRESGIMLVVILWILVVLSILAVGINQGASIEVALVKNGLGRVRARHIAMAGMRYAIDQIKKDVKTDKQREYDSRYQCGFSMEEGLSPEDMFKNIRIGKGYFDISYPADDGAAGLRYGFRDEESKLNLNALGYSNYKILGNLIRSLGYDEDTAEQIAAALVDWRDEDSEVFASPCGAEDAFYRSLERPYPCKNAPLDSLEEFMLIRGMDFKIFNEIKDYVTIFPKGEELVVNLNTASGPVLRAFAVDFAGAKTNTEPGDADSLVEKIIAHRLGPDGLEATPDDRPVDFDQIPLNSKEKVLAWMMQNAQTKISRFIRVRVRGVDEVSNAASDIQAVIAREEGAVVYWRRN